MAMHSHDGFDGKKNRTMEWRSHSVLLSRKRSLPISHTGLNSNRSAGTDSKSFVPESIPQSTMTNHAGDKVMR